MDDLLPKIPPGSTDYQLGVLHQRANQADEKFLKMENQIASLDQKMESIGKDVVGIKDAVVSSVKVLLEQQTTELKPILTEKMVRDANIKAAAEQRDRNSSFWQKIGAIVLVCSTIGAGLFGGIKWVFSELPHPAVHVMISPPSSVTVSPDAK
jgi:hypothetical protein